MAYCILHLINVNHIRFLSLLILFYWQFGAVFISHPPLFYLHKSTRKWPDGIKIPFYVFSDNILFLGDVHQHQGSDLWVSNLFSCQVAHQA
ncbi:hypothetical protein VY86_00470 [Photorhabdus thracensis]|uniref:Uncharacterized protein n=1 Tax=Photorhabdus thracensis TaxID=230089 RepID=A0A0F7LJ05_9GAMM|nr:hypothetical protein VY86_00470 [Photorhabdus thracensis]